ncbi:MAG: DUF2500 domain-containing protein [Ruminococcaceae bacterium]|nr:DUF2500 domain-containing protein [Oscillospiraceae bacterium]
MNNTVEFKGTDTFELDGGMVAFLCIMLFLLGLAIYCVYSFIKDMKKRKEDYEKLDEEIEEAPIDIVKAKVINKYTDTVYGISSKYPKHRIGYFLTFETEDGKTITYDVGEEIFNCTYAYTAGDLATSNGNFLDFK